jgi:hypothetical protein
MIDQELLDQLRSIKARTGISESEQVRQGIRWWLESRQWPKKSSPEPSTGNTPTAPPDGRRIKEPRP